MAASGSMNLPGLVVAALTPGDGRVRFCWTTFDAMVAGEWVVIEGSLGREPGQITFSADRVAYPPAVAPDYSIVRRMTPDEISQLDGRMTRVASMLDAAQAAIAEIEADAQIVSLRFALDAATLLCTCSGNSEDPSQSAQARLSDALGYPVRLEWTHRFQQMVGSLGGDDTSHPTDVRHTIAERLGIASGLPGWSPHGWPRLNAEVVTPEGTGRLVGISVRHQTATVRLTTGDEVAVAIGDLSDPLD